MNPILPTQDQWTTYDYDVGAKRIANAGEDKYHFLPFMDFECPGMPFIINFNDQLEYMKKHGGKVSSKLQVTGPEEFSADFKLISKQKTVEFATKSIEKWGREYAEKVLSATETGSLYYHVIHHFGSYEELLDEIDGGEKKRLKTSKE